MTRFDHDGEGGMPWELWQRTVSNALGGRRGQTALAELETALLALPEPRLVQSHLALDGAVCAVGAYVAHRRAVTQGEELEAVIRDMATAVPCSCSHAPSEHDGEGCHGQRWGGGECPCDEYLADEEDVDETAQAGRDAGLTYTVAWHFAYLNDEQFYGATPEDRYRLMLAWVRRAQGNAVA